MGSALHRDPTVETGGGSFIGLLREKENAYLCSFSLNQRTLKFKSWDHLKLYQGTGLA